VSDVHAAEDAEGGVPEQEHNALERGQEEPAAERPVESATEPTVRERLVQPVVVPRWIQLVMLPLAVLGLWVLARAAGRVLLIFTIAAVIALILNPLVSLLQRKLRLPRGLAVAAVYLGFFTALGGIGVLLANPISDQVAAFQKDVPGLVDDANKGLDNVQQWLDDKNINVQIKDQGSTALDTLQRNVLRGSGNVLTFTRDLLERLVEAAIALVLILVVSIYMLLYGGRIGALVRSIMPPGDGTPEDDYPTRVQHAVFGYVRGQILFSVAMGTGAGVALWLFGAIGIFPDGKTYALFFGAFFGLMELVPYLGPILGALPPILVALFQDPLTAVWVTILFVALQQVEGHIVAPLIFGQALRINPLLVIFALALGAEVAGIIGALLALPLLAIARETAAYLRGHLVFEPWGTASPEAVLAGRAAQSPAPAPPEKPADAPPPDAEAPEIEPEVAARK
jgi:predicted PurR-regulated permease PerM